MRIKSWVFLAGGILLTLAGFMMTRLPNLTALPIFTDEAIYIRWSQIGARDPNWRFISLTDGKQPMYTWITMILLRAFEGMDPLWIGRFTSVLAGMGTLIGIWFLTWELFRNRRLAWVASAAYIIMPFTVWYDRMALYDSLVSTFSVWGLYFAVLLAREPRLDTALILGMVLGGGMLNKSTGFLSLYLLPVTLIVFDWKGKRPGYRLMRWVMLAVLTFGLSQLIYAVLRLSPFFHMIGQKDNVFVFSLNEWLNQPFRFFAGNLRGMFDWLRHYMTAPLFFAAFATWFVREKFTRERLLLLLWWALPFAALANFGKVLYPRYILFMSLPLLILASYTLLRIWESVKRPIVRAFVLGTIVFPALLLTCTIVSNPVEADIPASDRGQFMDDWPAGGGVREVVTYLRSVAGEGPLAVFTEGTFGLMPYSLEIYLVDHPNVKITGLWPIPPLLPVQVAESATHTPTYFVMNETQQAPSLWPLTLIGEYQKGRSPEHKKLRLYRVETVRSNAL